MKKGIQLINTNLKFLVKDFFYYSKKIIIPYVHLTATLILGWEIGSMTYGQCIIQIFNKISWIIGGSQSVYQLFYEYWE